MGAFLILRCGVRKRESGMRQSIFVPVGGGGDPFSWMGAFLILRCGVRERESGMRQSIFVPLGGGGGIRFFFVLGGGRPPQLDGRILDSPVRRSRARIGNAPIHFCFPVGGGGWPVQLDGVRERESGMRQSVFFLPVGATRNMSRRAVAKPVISHRWVKGCWRLI